VSTVDVPGHGPVRLARWLQPEARASPVTIDPARIEAMRAHLQPGDAALVIGAAEGGEAVELALAVGPTGAVVALESDRAVFPVLAATAALNRERLRLLPHLVEVARAGVPIIPFGVDVQPLEPFLSARHGDLAGRLRWISFGFDDGGHALVEALQPLLTAPRPRLRIRVGRAARRRHRQSLLASLGELGYRVERFAGDGGPEALAPADVMRWKRLDLLAVP
jgi:hypothetical protein